MSNQNYPLPHLLFGMDILPLDGDHLRNNNNQNNLWQLRDRLFQVLFERATVGYANTIPHRLRKFIEIIFLVLVSIVFILIGSSNFTDILRLAARVKNFF